MRWPWSKRRRRIPIAADARPARVYLRSPSGARVAGKFDPAQTTANNRRHWANADSLSALAAATPAVRKILRERARYEVANNSYARGIVLTLANDTIGTGPRLQMLTDDPEANRRIEAEFSAWATAVDLAGKLRTMRMARAQDGEAFAVMINNEGLASAIQLDLRLIEADQVASPNLMAIGTEAGKTDGIELDAAGNPVAYLIRKAHPGSSTAGSTKYDRVPATSVIHWFRTDRPGQRRGLPDILPALELFAQLRRFTKAVLGSAETAASFSVLMKTTAPAGGEAAEVDPMTEMEIEPNTALFVPEGWDPEQLKPEQPATTYEMFKREIINEIARCLNIPYNVAAANSSAYNYASGRLDHQTYFKSIRVEQSHLEAVGLDRLLAAWLEEAAKVYALPAVARVAAVPHQWMWEGHEHVDPIKEARAQAARLTAHTTTLATEYARAGKDWETELRQRAKEIRLMRELGLSLKEASPAAAAGVVADLEDRVEEIEDALSN